MEPNEIVRALRCCLDKSDCSTCPMKATYETCQIDRQAADCIERLQAELEASQRRERAALKMCNTESGGVNDCSEE